MKKKFIAGGAVAAAVALLAIGTLAYFVSEARATNTITTGTVTIELNEYSVYSPEADGQQTAARDTGTSVPYEDPGVLMPGEAVDKIPIITNIGTADCWVRMRVELALEQETAQRQVEGQSGLAEMITINYDADNWVQEDGWYYYTEALAPGEAAAPLFDKVELSKEMGNNFQGAAFDIDIEAEAVQSKNNPLAGSNYAALWLTS